MKRFALPILLISTQLTAGTVAGNGGATEVTQISNNIQLMNQYFELAHQTQQLADQIRKQSQMVSDMEKQGKTVGTFEWGQTQADLQTLSRDVIEGQALAYSLSNLDARYRQTYKGYDAYTREQGQTPGEISQRYGNWSQTNLDTIRSSMRAAKLQESQFSSEEQTLKTLERMGSTAEGRMQALQVGTQISAMQVGQLQKLRALMMSQMQMQANYMAAESSKSDMQTAESRKFFQRTAPTTRVGNGKSF